MSRVEELPDDFKNKRDLNKSSTSNKQTPPNNGLDLVSQVLTDTPFPVKAKQQQDVSNGPSAALPPAMDNMRQYTPDEVVSMINRTPLFMTSLDETDGEGGTNVELEALRALAYEGTKAEVAQNFREQGNDHVRAKNWRDAKGYYDQALAALKDTEAAEQADFDIAEEVDEEAEKKKEVEIEEASYINRALCNLELSMLYSNHDYLIKRLWLIDGIKKTTAPATSTARQLYGLIPQT